MGNMGGGLPTWKSFDQLVDWKDALLFKDGFILV
jgi:hypothetical protein